MRYGVTTYLDELLQNHAPKATTSKGIHVGAKCAARFSAWHPRGRGGGRGREAGRGAGRGRGRGVPQSTDV